MMRSKPKCIQEELSEDESVTFSTLKKGTAPVQERVSCAHVEGTGIRKTDLDTLWEQG